MQSIGKAIDLRFIVCTACYNDRLYLGPSFCLLFAYDDIISRQSNKTNHQTTDMGSLVNNDHGTQPSEPCAVFLCVSFEPDSHLCSRLTFMAVCWVIYFQIVNYIVHRQVYQNMLVCSIAQFLTNVDEESCQ